MKKYISIVLILMLAIILCGINNQYATQGIQNEKIDVMYNTHIQDIGWEQDFSKKDGQTSGTTGKEKRLEAIKIKLSSTSQNISVKYQVHVENIGWQNWKKDGEMAGTSGQGLRLEGIKIQLENSEKYSIMYRVHVQDIGWQDWKSDGEMAGTTGQYKRLEAIEIKVVDKIEKGAMCIDTTISDEYYENTTINVSGWKMANVADTKIKVIIDNTEDLIQDITYRERQDVIKSVENYGTIKENPKPGFNFTINTDGILDGEHTITINLITKENKVLQTYSKKFKMDRGIHIQYQAHVESIGWQGYKVDGQTSGTTGKYLQMEAIKINLINLPEGVNIKYKTHVESIGWQDWKNNGTIAGTTGKNLQIEAIKIVLEGSSEYSIMYRTHVEDIGWQPWCYDGDTAGTEGKSKAIQAIEIKIVDKKEKGVMCIDTTISDEYYENAAINVSGWKMANVADTKIKVIIDNTEDLIQDITYRERQDVIKSVENYGTIKENPKPGFNFTINTDGILDGEHTITINLITKENKILQTYSKKFKIDRGMHIQYQAHVQDIGWQDWKNDGKTAGTIGQYLQIEAIKINAINLPEGMTIKYQTHVESIGWQDWNSNNTIGGTTGKKLQIEAIKIKIEGNSEYSVVYRTHVEDIGWQPWCYDSETSGTEGISKAIQAIEIKLMPKISQTKIDMYIDSPQNQVTNVSQNIKGWIMASIDNVSLKIFIDEKEISTQQLRRTIRQDVLNAEKGFGDFNKTPGFELPIDFSQYSLGTHSIKVQAISQNNVIKEISNNFIIRKNIYYTTGTYGWSGLKQAGDPRGTDLPYYQYGSGPNVFFATFAIHGFEDLWAKDGQELVQIANDFWQRLLNSNDYNLADKWTIYIFPGVNQDGLNHGTTCNGPGRTTLFSAAPNRKGIDMNRCWQIGNSYTRYTNDRNYNGTSGFQAYEADYLKTFLLNHKSNNGQTILVDLHGWYQQFIGDEGISAYYNKQFPENDKSSLGRYGTGYLINWARSSLGSAGRTARTALVELPWQGINGHQSVINHNFSNRYIEATLDMLRNINV